MSRTPQRAAAGPNADAPRLRRYCVGGQSFDAPPLPGGLYVVATPIGNLRDITVRGLETLAAADLIACEDTRVTRKLLERYGIATPLTPYHEHNAEQARPRLLARLAEGATVALVSDAGTPLISDPGYKLVRAAREAVHPVTPLPGPSAVLAALVTSGLPSDRFFFEGFLPAKETPRRRRIVDLARIPATLILFETGPRLADSLRDLAAALAPRRAVVCRELTKVHEEAHGDDLAALAQAYAGASAPRGEIVIVIAPPVQEAQAVGPQDTDALLRAALGRTSLKDAVSEIAAVTGQPRRDIYQRALAISREPDDDGRA
jgi:16S rRNA (cytidine1402-2'-O)-methyltransferase